MIATMLPTVCPREQKSALAMRLAKWGYGVDPALSEPSRIVVASPPERHSTPLILNGITSSAGTTITQRPVSGGIPRSPRSSPRRERNSPNSKDHRGDGMAGTGVDKSLRAECKIE